MDFSPHGKTEGVGVAFGLDKRAVFLAGLPGSKVLQHLCTATQLHVTSRPSPSSENVGQNRHRVCLPDESAHDSRTLHRAVPFESSIYTPPMLATTWTFILPPNPLTVRVPPPPQLPSARQPAAERPAVHLHSEARRSLQEAVRKPNRCIFTPRQLRVNDASAPGCS
jgi:hypothetical protein